jgi:hypothetical protein
MFAMTIEFFSLLCSSIFVQLLNDYRQATGAVIDGTRALQTHVDIMDEAIRSDRAMLHDAIARMDEERRIDRARMDAESEKLHGLLQEREAERTLIALAQYLDEMVRSHSVAHHGYS